MKITTDFLMTLPLLATISFLMGLYSIGLVDWPLVHVSSAMRLDSTWLPWSTLSSMVAAGLTHFRQLGRHTGRKTVDELGRSRWGDSEVLGRLT